MKTVKRIIAVILLIVALLVICYVCKTCGRLKGGKSGRKDYISYSFYSNDGEITLVIDENLSGTYVRNGAAVILPIVSSGGDGILLLSDGNTEYAFIFTDTDDLYDISGGRILYRSAVYE